MIYDMREYFSGPYLICSQVEIKFAALRGNPWSVAKRSLWLPTVEMAALICLPIASCSANCVVRAEWMEILQLAVKCQQKTTNEQQEQRSDIV